MSLNLILDTSAYSELRKGNSRVQSLVEAAHEIFMPVVVIAELEYGFVNGSRHDANHRELERFLADDSVQILYLDLVAYTQSFAELKLLCKESGRALSEHDLWITALAKETGLPLLTLDQDFKVFEEILGKKLILLPTPPKKQ